MIDIHCHILPRIDDGPKTLFDSLNMAKAAVRDGIHTVIATPHHSTTYYNAKADILHYVQDLNDALQEENIDLKVRPGQETRIYGELVEDLKKGDILPLNETSSYLFIEFPSSGVPLYADKLLYDIQVAGLTPVIVHPERNAELIERPGKLYQLVKNGAATQITAGSLVGDFGKKISQFSQQIIEANLTHFIASDAHNTTNRPFKMAEAMNFVEKKYGVDMLYYFTENAELLLEDSSIIQEVPQRIAKKKFLGIF
ncbi:tyrosine-protein phosphatase [Bacillus fonticola]|uniref:tyrosine-protein phosphatase n=1 Tax=Bacillus fonticola TaxID=2728853 RepID=UPI0014764C81|nr:CpsB/CapC family capsule biosynthesis tyrosine phosphatase [Bacillus fonticola]